MKNKGTILALTLIIAMLCIYQLHFTFVTGNVEEKAEKKATNKKGIIEQDEKRKYLDSLWNSDKKVHSLLVTEYTYKEVKEKELGLGLDLQGGMHVTLEISPKEIVKALSGDSPNKDFLKALEEAEEAQASSQESFADLFADAFAETPSKGKLGRIFTNTANRDKINPKKTDSEVITFIKDELEDSFDRALEVIKTRIDRFGVANPSVQELPGTGRILLELPGVDNPERVRKLLSGVAKLEFWEVFDISEIGASIQQLAVYMEKENKARKDKKIKKKDKKDEKEEEGLDLSADNDEEEENSLLANNEEEEKEEDVEEDSTKAENETKEKKDSVKTEDKTEKKKDSTDNEDKKKDKEDEEGEEEQIAGSFFQQIFKINPQVSRDIKVALKDTAYVNDILARDEVKRMFSSEVKFLWGKKPEREDEAKNLLVLYAVKKRGGLDQAPIAGDVVSDASQDFDERSRPAVSMSMNVNGASQWRKLTGQNVNRRVAIVLDGYVYSAPNVTQEIPNGQSSISGNFTVEEAQDLANILKAGKLPTPVKIVEEAVVGPSLGQESISQGLTSMLIGLGLVIVFMILYYKSGGFAANVALIVNLFFIVGILAQFGAVLTLPGIAGIVLTIGMSVDANVLIYERIREELASGISLRHAINQGYEKAYSSIIDANATTFITAVILYLSGAGPVKGFAVTLMIGILCSLFTAIFITRIIIEALMGKKKDSGVAFDSLIFKNTFSNLNISFVSLRRIAYIASSATIILGIVLMIAQGGLNLGVDFKGGRSYVVEFNSPITVNAARAELAKEFKGGIEVKTYGGNNKLKITTSYLINDDSNAATKKVEDMVMGSLEKFKNKSPKIVSTSKVGSTIADDIANTAYWTVLYALLAIFTYIWIRFLRWQYGLGALAALVHDVLVVLTFLALAQLLGFAYEVDQVFIAAILTVVGYSINDTVVVFDRIREFAGDTKRADFSDRLNKAINSTLGRTVMTSSTTLLVVLILFLFGGEVLRGFSYSLLIGVLVGTYSSVFIASPIVLDISLLQSKKAKKPKESKKAEAKV